MKTAIIHIYKTHVTIVTQETGTYAIPEARINFTEYDVIRMIAEGYNLKMVKH